MRPEPTPTDDLIAALNGCSDALGRLLMSFWDDLRAIADQELASDLQAREAPSDVVAVSVAEALVTFPEFKGQTHQALFAWLAKIVRNNAKDAGKRHRAGRRSVSREVSLDDTPVNQAVAGQVVGDNPSPSSDAAWREQGQRLLQVFASLSSTDRQVILLRHMKGCSPQQIADRLGISVDAAKKRCARALLAFKAKASAHGIA